MLIAASGSLRGCLLEGSAVPVVGDAGYILVLRCRESETSDLESKLSKEQAIHLLNFGSSCVWISVFYSELKHNSETKLSLLRNTARSESSILPTI